MLRVIRVVTFFYKNVVQLEVEITDRNSHISMPATVRTLIFHILTLHTLLTYLKKCQKYTKLLYILRLHYVEIFCIKKLTKLRKKMPKTNCKLKQNHIKIDVINLETCNSTKSSSCYIFEVTISFILHQGVFICVLYHLVEFQLGNSKKKLTIFHWKLE